MNYLLLLLAGQLATVPPLPAAPAMAGNDTKAVYVKGKEIFVVSGAGSPARQLTRDGLAKALPAWSKDGSAIAFVETTEDMETLGRLLVVDEDGHTLQNLPLHRGARAGGMRFIEDLEWLDHGRVAISGSANPSLSESTIVTLASGEQEVGIFDDGPGADFSPDGKHLALTSGAPHFTPSDEKEPALEIDYKRVYPAAGVHVELVSERSWSPDSRKVAVIVRDFATQRQKLVIALVGGGVTEQDMDLPAGAQCELVWVSGEAVAACTAGDRAMKAIAPSADGASAQRAVDLLRQALSERSRLLATIASVGGKNADVWCKTCPLSKLPRKTLRRE